MINEYRDICFDSHQGDGLHRRREGCPAVGTASSVLDALPRMPSPGARLTRRQLQVLVLVAEGLTNEQIGRRLGCAPGTVSTQMRRVLAKLEAPSRAAAVDQGWRLGYLGRDAAGPERHGAAS